MDGMEIQVSIFTAFAAGLVSFLSPCIFPLIPAYVSYITGIAFDELVTSNKSVKRTALFHSLAFVLGFSCIFIAMGATATTLGKFLIAYQKWIQRVGGILILLFGLFLLRVFSFSWMWREARFQLKDKPSGFFGSFLVGVVFASGWTPCVGPILGSVLIYSSQTATLSSGLTLLAFYSLGLGIPFILASVFLSSFLALFRKMKSFFVVLEYGSGIFLVLVGLALLTGTFTRLSAYLLTYFSDWVELLVRWGI